MKVRYVGTTFGFGIDGLTNHKIYNCIAIEYPFLRVIDDSGEDYLYSTINPGEFEGESEGYWEIINDNKNRDLFKLMNTNKK